MCSNRLVSLAIDEVAFRGKVVVDWSMDGPQPDGLMAKVDPALEQEILNVQQRQRKSHVEHDR